ncbi:MAG: response regulator [Bradymonadaceae bacterium]
MVEDDTEMRALLGQILRDRGYRVAAVPAPNRAMSVVEGLGEHDNPLYALDLVIVDWWMPSMTGGEFLAWLRDQNLNTPVIVISGYVAAEVVDAASEVGAADILSKPFELDDFVDCIEHHLEG